MNTSGNHVTGFDPLQRHVLKLLREGPQTIADMAESLDRSAPSVAHLLKELSAEGWVAEDGQAASTGGRRPKLFRLMDQKGWALGIDVGRRTTRLIAIDLTGKVLVSSFHRSPNLNDPKEVLDRVDHVRRKLLDGAGLDDSSCLGVGFALPGLVDSVKGTAHTYMDTERPVREILAERFGHPTLIVHDGRAMVYGEHRLGSARNYSDALLVNIGWGGIGMGIMLSESLHFGAHRHAGEFGHLTVDPDGEICSCGKRGCLETVCSGIAMASRVTDQLRRGEKSRLTEMVEGDLERIDTGVLVQAIQQGDQLAINELLDTSRILGKNLATLLMLFDPEVIVIGGYVSSVGAILIDSLRASARANVVPGLARDVNIVQSELGSHSASLGAALMVIDPLFEEPVERAPSVRELLQ